LAHFSKFLRFVDEDPGQNLLNFSAIEAARVTGIGTHPQWLPAAPLATA
jgi:hypothetical protein